jgi:hypothetical protein
MSITADRAHAYMHHYAQSSELVKPHHPTLSEVFAMCSIMCMMMRFTATSSAFEALKLIGDEERTHPYKTEQTKE